MVENNDIPIEVLENRKGYSLRLADSNSWGLSSSIDAISWVDKLASIMELKTERGSHKRNLIFVRNYLQTTATASKASPHKGAPGNGWKVNSIGPLRLLSHPGSSNLICDLGDEGEEELEYNKMWQALYPLYLHSLTYGGLPLHAALVERDGKSYAIAAPGGTGKSTCARRIPLPWRALCDDEVLVVRDAAGIYHAHPLPTWKEYLYYKSNRTWNVQYHAPLAGIFFLVQSENNEVEPIGQGKATTFIYRSASQVFYKSWLRINPDTRSELRIQAFENASRMAESIPTFLMRVSLTGSFWEKMVIALQRGETPP